jgi:hypothetical protein
MPGGQRWKCLCKCGEIVITQISGGSKSCKRCAYEQTGKDRTIHNESPSNGKSATRLYRIWTGMRNRCNNVRNKNYNDYGGRGITVCDEWNEYLNFKKWSMENGYKDDLSIDRINNDKGYSPNNCRWVSRTRQMNNTRHNSLITINNITRSVIEWCRELNIGKGNLYVNCKKLNIPVDFVIKYCFANQPRMIPYKKLSEEWNKRSKDDANA